MARPLPVGPYAVASRVYVQIDKGSSMSPYLRLMWYLKRLGTIQTVDKDLEPDSPDKCKVISYEPRKENITNNNSTTSNFVMDALTNVYFLTPVYNMVYCLDMSPSNCTVVR